MFPTENPFASRYVRPGALNYLFPGDDDAQIDRLIDRLAASAWRGAIVGPHGSGKTTLIAAMSVELGRRGIEVQQVQWDTADGPKHLRRALQRLSVPTTVLFVDGFDRLPPWRRWLLRQRCRRNSCGLVVTGHTPVGRVFNLSGVRRQPRLRFAAGRVGNPSYRGLPVLVNMHGSAQLAERIAAALAGETFASGARRCIHASFARHDGNLREVLFDLYDLYERQTRQERTIEALTKTPVEKGTGTFCSADCAK